MARLKTTTDAYTVEEILDFLEETDDDLSDELKDDLNTLSDDAQWQKLGETFQMNALTDTLTKLIEDGEVEVQKD